MRLIDADALKAEFDKNCAMECGCCDHATCNHVGNAVGCGLVNAAPTIDAIPVEWLIDRANAPERAPLYRRYAQMLYEEWQKEQEAR